MSEFKTANTGHWSKPTAWIRSPPWEQYAKMFRTVHLQHSSHSTTNTVTLAAVVSNIRPNFGWYVISFTIYGPFCPSSKDLQGTVEKVTPEISGQAWIDFLSFDVLITSKFLLLYVKLDCPVHKNEFCTSSPVVLVWKNILTELGSGGITVTRTWHTQFSVQSE